MQAKKIFICFISYMNIQPISYTNPNFGTCARRYFACNVKSFDKFEPELIRTSTNLFREDLNWDLLIRHIMRNFMAKSKVQTYSLACSDGSEAYSYILTILNKIPKIEIGKYFPIIASDIDKEMIKTAKSGRINIADFEYDFFENPVVKMSKFFKNKSEPIEIANDKLGIKPIHSYRPVKELRKNVMFRVNDILSEIENIKDESNTVVMCRNVFPYLNEEYTDNVILSVSNKLKTGSIFVTGDYDEKVNISQKLLNNGFFNPICGENNIFQRK